MSLEDFNKFIIMYETIIKAVGKITDITWDLRHQFGDKQILLQLVNIENNAKIIRDITNKTLGVDK